MVSSTTAGLQQRGESLRLATEEGSRCRKEPTPDARRACVARQNAALH